MSDARTDSRHSHKKGISRFGGVALIMSFLVAIFLDKNLVISAPLLGVLIASVLILFLGVIDDIKQVSWKLQLFSQLLIVILIYVMGVRLQYITNPFGGVLLFNTGLGSIVGFIISACWILFIMNAMNWIDGDDGVVGGVTFIGVISIFFLSLRPDVNQPPIAIITMTLAGGLLAFTFFNFHPAKIMAGTSGSVFMGFVLSVLAIFAGAKIATTLLVLTVPIVDAIWVIGERLKVGDSIFSADKKHLHFRLREIGWSSKQICMFYYFITALVAFFALNASTAGKGVIFIVIALMMIALLFAVRRKTLLI